MDILGIHDGHNAAAALLRDGIVVAAVQEERITRRKNHDAFPANAIARVLSIAGLSAAGVDLMALNGSHQPRRRTREELMASIRVAGGVGVGARIKRGLRRSPGSSKEEAI